MRALLLLMAVAVAGVGGHWLGGDSLGPGTKTKATGGAMVEPAVQAPSSLGVQKPTMAAAAPLPSSKNKPVAKPPPSIKSNSPPVQPIIPPASPTAKKILEAVAERDAGNNAGNTPASAAETAAGSVQPSAFDKAKEAASKYMDTSKHRWRPTQDCNPDELEHGRKLLEDLTLWPKNMQWLTNAPKPGTTGPNCLHAKAVYRSLGSKDGNQDTSAITRELTSHWGIVYFFDDGTVRTTDLCLDVCDVREGIDGNTYHSLLALWSVLEPIPIQQCTWVEDDARFVNLATLSDETYECEQMWESQKIGWEDWEPKTWSPGRNCGQLVMQQVDTYHGMLSNAKKTSAASSIANGMNAIKQVQVL